MRLRPVLPYLVASEESSSSSAGRVSEKAGRGGSLRARLYNSEVVSPGPEPFASRAMTVRTILRPSRSAAFS
jgi:hypothetical protein